MKKNVMLCLLCLCGAFAFTQAGPKETNNNNQPPPPEVQVKLSLESKTPVAEVSARFLSFAVDTAQVVGGEFWDPDGSQSMIGGFKVEPYDFGRVRLRTFVKELLPAYLRVGGSTADETYYDLSDNPVKEAPEHYKWVLTRKMWDGIHDFVKEHELRLLFTLNAGKGPRGDKGLWSADNARTLMKYAKSKGTPVDIWELGNEINGYRLLLGLALDEQGYTEDLKVARQLLKEEAPDARLAGPSCAFWPKTGDFIGFYEKFMKIGGGQLDLVTWHYYPQQSRRCPAAVRPATPETLMDPENLAEVDKWADVVEKAQQAHASRAEVWLGETGNAQCGGEPGVSDAFAGGFWWLDQLGRMARRGQKVVIRQTLSGSNYGLLNDKTLDPKPDYWNSVLFKRLMGTKVFKLKASAPRTTLRAYAHCAGPKAGAQSGALTFLLLNLDPKAAIRVQLDGLKGPAQRYVVTADGLQATELKLNGVVLKPGAQDAMPAFTPQEQAASDDAPYVDLPAYSYAFVVLPAAGIAACQ